MPKFLHVADPHIDSSMKALPRNQSSDEESDSPTRDAFAKAVTLAIEEKVDLMVIAGDLFDGDWKDGGTWEWTRQQFCDLEAAGVPVAFLRGNHDAESALQTEIRWPPNVYEFPTDRAESKEYEAAGLVVHGRGYSHRETFENLAAGYPKARRGLFNVGVLHTALEGSSQHARYAPCSPAELLAHEYGYWALGHVHKPTAAADWKKYSVPILFAGNPQGRDIGETGPRGAVLVEVKDGVAKPQFRELDSLRWYSEVVGAENCETTEELLQDVRRTLKYAKSEAGRRTAVVRLELSGPFEEHEKIDRVANFAVFEGQVLDIARELGGILIESLRVSTTPALDLDQVFKEGGLIAEVLTELDAAIAAAEGRDELLDGVQDAVAEAGKKLDVPASLSEVQAIGTPQDRARWLRSARSHLIARLASEV